jgi:hypothetical protein
MRCLLAVNPRCVEETNVREVTVSRNDLGKEQCSRRLDVDLEAKKM